MPEIYRKRGSVVRFEHDTFVRSAEAGEAIEEDGVFRCRPLRDARRLPPPGDESIRDAIDRIRDSVPDGVSIERLILTDGIAEHECDGRRWTDQTRRIHLSLTAGRHRVMFDEGSFDTGGIAMVAASLGRVGDERSVVRARLGPRVMAAVTPLLLSIAPPNVVIEQTGGGTDGKGLPIEPGGSAWYRPSYRVRPFRAPTNIAARCTVTTVERSLPQAIALLAPPRGLQLRVLCIDGDDSFPATVRLDRIDAISDRQVWYPVETGVWAGEAEVA